VIEELYRLAGIYKTCIVCVLHFIPNGLKLRGHLGSELQRKAAAILSMGKDENPQIFVVKALKVRNGSPLDVPLVQFFGIKNSKCTPTLAKSPKRKRKNEKRLNLQALSKTFSAGKNTVPMSICANRHKLFWM
jgi:hypothetical protein